MENVFEENLSVSLFTEQSGSVSAFAIPASTNSIDIYLSPPSIMDRAGIEFKSLKKLNPEIYTPINAIYEDESSNEPYWATELLEENRVLGTFAYSDFKNNGNVVWVAGDGIYEGNFTSISSYTQHRTTCPKNGVATTLINDRNGSWAYFCEHVKKSEVDTSILVNATAFPYWVVTNDTCLLWCSWMLGSYSQDSETRKLVRYQPKDFKDVPKKSARKN